MTRHALPAFPLALPVTAVLVAVTLALPIACRDSTSPVRTLQLSVAAGNGQTGVIGYPLNVAPAVRVQDGSAPAVGVQVSFAVTGGGGSVTGASATTGTDGVARVGSWTVQSGTNTLRATVSGTGISGGSLNFTATGVSPAYHVALEYLSTVSPARQAVFDGAAARWEQLIFGDVPDIVFGPGDSLPAGTCGSNSPTIKNTIDDILILVTLDSIDGPGKVLGQAGPCYVRIPGLLPLLGIMHLDTADVATLEANGLFEAVIVHEMGHILGFGPLWADSTFNLLADSGGTDPHFIGQQAIAAFDADGGVEYTGGAKVPVENCLNLPPGTTCGQGQRDGHWRETVFANELMTAYLNSGSNPLSVITTASLGDEGYLVNYAASDPYTVANPLGAAPLGARPAMVEMGDDISHLPVYGVGRSGRVVGVIRPQ